MASCHRLLDIVDLVESDPRVQTVFTVPPDVFNTGVAGHLERLGALVVPWQQAVRERFDLAIAASHGGLHELHAPVMLMAHGAGRSRLVRPPDSGGRPVGQPSVYGLDAPRLVRDGRVIASAIVLSHENEWDVLARQCPDALRVATVAGDPCLDRLAGSMSRRGDYRRSLGLADRQRLVVVTSTWGGDGLFGGVPELLPAMMEQLPPSRFRVALLLHPAIAGAHGRRQVGAWTRACQEAGMMLAEPGDDWRAYVAAADCLVGDRGSVTAYGAAVGLPVLCVSPGSVDRTAAGSPQSVVLSGAARLDVTKPLRPQLLAARPVDPRRVAAAITSRPHRAGRLLRRTMFRLLGLTQRRGSQDPPLLPVPAPGRSRTAS
ncbi:hypothetical protein GCM10010172_18610 [Paractinoplanes ferrugineus]|uniref:Uncharacterized protein n=1 Tax=Paractinoplanes ferrugineus TaxID=113564 RepID=A0A919J887_9ACTN|nr:hypothetical protein [Actinoplanes ferrugineus]GIE14848.1 hypothetical protein Afe05nite_66880 [Actinoplanes ferrugineus]